MTVLVNDPEAFAGEALEGFVSAQPDHVLGLPGGVIRAAATEPGQVAIVMGGGSGHFPAFAGWVGVGFGTAAACGNIFASPAESQVLRVARAAEAGGGLLFLPINYAGDILHFGSASERLRAEGIDVRTVPITDDIASGESGERGKRRGIAGSFLVIKMAGAAAEEGRTLDEVERIAIAANDATRSFGVAFSGCTLPGADGPLFTVPVGRVAVGLGIHGEPGLAEVDLESGDAVADLVVDGLFRERAPEAGQRVAVLVNGLGATKYDELHLFFRRARARIEEAGMTLVSPVVGEQVTSLDMAGISLSITYLDDELEALWLAPADAASFFRGAGSLTAGSRRGELEEVAEQTEIPEASAESRSVAALIAAGFGTVEDVLRVQEKRLGQIDAVAGDGDHGIGMLRGAAAAASAANAAVAQGAGAGTVLRLGGGAWSDVGGGTSGALWGAGLAAAGDVVGVDAILDSATVLAAVRAFADVIVDRGKAQPGDKTMVDAILPFVGSLEREVTAGTPLADAWRAAAAAATDAADRTAEIASRLGRSRIHGDRSIGTPDAGAVSFALIVASVIPSS